MTRIMKSIVFITLVVMSVLSWYFIVANFLRNLMIRARADRVRHTFWEIQSTQDAMRFLENQPKSEPFSKIALDCASAAAHHQRNEGSRLVEALNRSEFIDRALRQAVAVVVRSASVAAPAAPACEEIGLGADGTSSGSA